MIKVKDKDFVPFISSDNLASRVSQLGVQISNDFAGEDPILLGVLNGSFMFLSDLAKHVTIPAEISLVKIASYSGTVSTGDVKTLMGLDIDLTGRSVIIVEDIVDSGLTMDFLISLILKQTPKKIAIATLLLKPEAFKYDFKIDYIGFEIPNKFVVGYGLDYDGWGRNLPEIYQLKN
ncbi:hypoxanthine phosphoribosyltransferase [Rhodonellum sp.]|uniref:hypoxanthine phosphoribosyltransferase n=1 Tax=Rhodonellum sp. TaxID=2231180 RepID=UPI0027191573|nr:hypoxanthine phosphoribosyltransferase [Rhodonellum sp.]MDO9552049.1 hypoxanthine phosphoribosyltransferase [Rhodonellum sp.]